MGKDQTTMKIDKDLLKKICEMKVHPRQSSSEVLRKILTGKSK